MIRALVVLLSVACISLVGCSQAKEKKDNQASAKKSTAQHDHDKHDDKHNSKHTDKVDPHAPSKEPLKIVDDVVRASDHATEKFANDHTRVIEIELHKGEKLPLHKSGSHVVYALTDLQTIFTEVHGDHTHGHKDESKAGTVHAHQAGAHSTANVADEDAQYVMFVRKPGDAFTASMPADAKSITDVSKHAIRLLSNDDFRVLKVALPPGKQVAKHFALNRLIYALDDGQVTFVDATGEADPHDLKVGHTHFLPAGFGTLKNSGDTNISLLVIELKQ